ncbi:hypothetical protein BDV11DRAFT_185781 [Aspergillus similis]
MERRMNHVDPTVGSTTALVKSRASAQADRRLCTTPDRTRAEPGRILCESNTPVSRDDGDQL